MATNFPSSLDTTANLPSPSGTTLLADSTVSHALHHTNENGAIIALETKLGVSAGSPTLNKVLTGSGNGTSTWSSTVNSLTLGTPSITAPTIIGAGTLSGTLTGGMIGTSTLQGGTVNVPVGTINTLTSGTITNSGTTNGIIFGVSIAPNVGTITDSAGGTFIVNAQAAQIYYSAMSTQAGNRTIGTPTNPQNYQLLTYAWKASGSANGTLVWPSGIFRISQDFGTPILGTGTSWNYFSWRYNAIDSKYDFQGNMLNLV